MLLTGLVLANNLRPLPPALLLSLSGVPYSAVIVATTALSSVLPRTYRVKVDNFLFGFYQRLVLFVFENMSGVQMSLYGDVDEYQSRKENVIFISNHQCSVDWAVADMLAVRQGTLGGLRYMLKDTLQYLPLFGWYFYQGNFNSQNATSRELAYLAGMAVPFWLVIFPEGTRFSAKKSDVINASRQFALNNSLEPLDFLLTPKWKGFVTAFSALRTSLDAVYDVTIAYEQTKLPGRKGRAPDMFEFCCGSLAHKRIHIHLERIPVSGLPENEDHLKKWLHERFVVKNRLMDDFYSGDLGADAFPRLSVAASCLPLRSTAPALTAFSIMLCPLFLRNGFWRKLYALYGVAASCLLIAWMKVRKAV